MEKIIWKPSNEVKNFKIKQICEIVSFNWWLNDLGCKKSNLCFSKIPFHPTNTKIQLNLTSLENLLSLKMAHSHNNSDEWQNFGQNRVWGKYVFSVHCDPE